MNKNPIRGPWAGCRLNRPIGFAPWPAQEEWTPIYDVEDDEADRRRRLIASLPEEGEEVPPDVMDHMLRMLDTSDDDM